MASASMPAIRAILPFRITVNVPPNDWVRVIKAPEGIVTGSPVGTKRAAHSLVVVTIRLSMNAMSAQ